MRFPAVHLFFVFSVGLILQAGNWAPIPPEVWAMKEDKAQGIAGAVVLEDRIHFREKYLEYVRRVRILSEAGKDAMDGATFSTEAHDIDGRTVYRDGRSIVFNSRKDFQEKAMVSTAGEDLKRIRLIPPGLSGDCVVELKWKEPVDPDWGPMPKSYGYMRWWRLGGAYRTLLTVLELPSRLYWAQMLQYQSHHPQVEVKGDLKTYTFTNLPPMAPPPYSTEFALDVPRFTLYAPLSALSTYSQTAHPEYWKAAVELLYKPYFEKGIRKASAYHRLRSEIAPGLPPDPRSQAIEVLHRLNRLIINVGQMTKNEEGRVSRGEKLVEPSNLEEIARSGYASASGFRLLYYHLLKDLGLKPQVALVADRDRWQFRYAVHNIFQFTDELIGIGADPATTIWIDPTERFVEPGLVDPDYQGTWALAVDTSDWSAKPFLLPANPASSTKAVHDYRLTLEEDADRFELTAEFTGHLATRHRRRFALLDQREQDRLLKERFEGVLKGVNLSRAEVVRAREPIAPVQLKVAGSLEQDPGRKRTVTPFPGMDWPLWIPDFMPEERRIPIQIPYRRTWEAVSRFLVPKGLDLAKVEPLDQGNNFGQVRWSAVQGVHEGQAEVTVTFQVTVSAHTVGSEYYKAFKTFLGWVEDAQRRTVTLDRLP